MYRNRSTNDHRRSRTARARRRRAVWGVGTTAGAALVFGMGPLGVAPRAHADEFDVILDPIINALSGSWTGVVDPLAGVDALPGLDVGSAVLPAAHVADTSSLALPAEALAGMGLSADSLAGVGGPAAGSDVIAELDALLYPSLHAAEQAWITSPLGEVVDQDINALFGQDLIGDGASGTVADPTGGAAGLLFGDGGAG